MGGSTWSDSHYRDRATLRSKTGKKTFAYDNDIRSGKSAKAAHQTLDPAKLKAGKREARDSDEHPESNPVFVGLDVTASMSVVPTMIQKKLPSLMGLLLRKGYLTDPAICVSAIGDVECDSVPLQIGQFESGIEIEDDITNLYMEGGGGGNRHESYDLALYFLARCTSCDAFEKRGKKGYAFIICDEELRPHVSRSAVARVFGDDHKLEADIGIETILAEALEKWELYCIVPKLTNHFSDPSYKERWRDLLGERVLLLEDPDGISELIASCIGVLEDNADMASLATDLKDEGASDSVAAAVGTALAKVGDNAGLAIAGANTGLTEL